MKIGGGGRKPFRTPNTSGMQDRVNNTLRQLALSHNTKMTMAVGIDAPDCVIFQKQDGAIGCTCTYGLTNTRRFDNLPLDSNTDDQSDDDYMIQDPGADVGSGLFNQRVDSPIIQDSDEDDDVPMDIDAYDIGSEDDYSNLEIDNSVVESLKQIKPASYGDTIKCFACVGASMVDAWQPFRGLRQVCSFTPQDRVTYSAAATLRQDAKPYQLELAAGQWVKWEISLPRAFLTLLRFQVWKDSKAVQKVTASLHRKGDPTIQYPATQRDITRLNGQLGKDWVLRLDAHEAVDITHVEFQFLMGDMVKGQFPPIEIPYDHDYHDYNLTSTVEFSAEVDIKEGDLIAENKWCRLWRVSAVNKKALSDGTGFGVQADIRVVQPKEVYYLLNPFAKGDFNYKLFLGQDTATEFKTVRT